MTSVKMKLWSEKKIAIHRKWVCYQARRFFLQMLRYESEVVKSWRFREFSWFKDWRGDVKHLIRTLFFEHQRQTCWQCQSHLVTTFETAISSPTWYQVLRRRATTNYYCQTRRVPRPLISSVGLFTEKRCFFMKTCVVHNYTTSPTANQQLHKQEIDTKLELDRDRLCVWTLGSLRSFLRTIWANIEYRPFRRQKERVLLRDRA